MSIGNEQVSPAIVVEVHEPHAPRDLGQGPIRNASGARFCACSLCGTWWNYVRIKCVTCGSTKGIAYQEIDGGAGTIKAETCSECGTYVKILQQQKDPSLEPIADDVASLGLDLLVRETGLRRAGVDPFLIGY